MMKGENLDVSPETIQGLISLANKKIRKEDIHPYKDLPEEIRKMIDDYANHMGMNPLDRRTKVFKKQIADSLLEDFIANIQIEKVQKDFNVELEQIFNKASEEIGEEIAGYTETKLARYREAAEKMEAAKAREDSADAALWDLRRAAASLAIEAMS
jgi:uncharacterized protein YpuA (DUF1002 family)